MVRRALFGREPLGRRRLLAIARRTAVGAAVLSCTAVLVVFLMNNFSIPFLFDFKGDLYSAGQAILHGHSPYDPGRLAAQAALQRATGTAALTFAMPVYPVPALLAALPFSLLPFWLAGGLYTLLSIAALIVGLRLLEVRDWRCIALALISWPFLLGLYFGALGPLLVLGTGVAWRSRDRLWVPAAGVASLILAKLFPWPVALWLLVTRRFRALLVTLSIVVFALVAGWAVIGFAGMTQYPRMLASLSVVEQGKTISLASLLIILGVSATVATAVALGAATALLSVGWRFARRPDGDRRALALAVIAALTASPIVWGHYLVLLFVPIALLSPRLSAIWFVPLLAGLDPVPRSGGLASTLFWLMLEAVVVVWVCWPSPAWRKAHSARGRLGWDHQHAAGYALPDTRAR